MREVNLHHGRLAGDVGFAPVGEEGVVIDALSQSYSVYAVDSVNTFVWLDNNVTPLFYMLGGGYLVYYFDLPDSWTNATWGRMRMEPSTP